MSQPASNEPRHQLEAEAFQHKKESYKRVHEDYVHKHPELQDLLGDFVAACLLEQPSDVLAFAKAHFGKLAGSASLDSASAASAAASAAAAAASSSSAAAALRPVVMCGPSGVGKSTLIQRLRAEYPDRFGFSVSHTTRAPRPGEQHGREYFFVEKAAMQADIDAGLFIESANVHGNLYGTSIAAVKSVQQAGRVCILDIDVQGVRSVKRTDLNPLCIFILPPSMKELERRLRTRGTDSEESIRKRLDDASAEIDAATTEGIFDHLIENTDLDATYAALKAALKPVLA